MSLEKVGDNRTCSFEKWVVLWESIDTFNGGVTERRRCLDVHGEPSSRRRHGERKGRKQKVTVIFASVPLFRPRLTLTSVIFSVKGRLVGFLLPQTKSRGRRMSLYSSYLSSTVQVFLEENILFDKRVLVHWLPTTLVFPYTLNVTGVESGRVVGGTLRRRVLTVTLSTWFPMITDGGSRVPRLEDGGGSVSFGEDSKHEPKPVTSTRTVDTKYRR